MNPAIAPTQPNADEKPNRMGFHRVGVVKWSHDDGIAGPIVEELVDLGYEASGFHYDAPVPNDTDVIVSFAPYGPLQPLFRQLEKMHPGARPFVVHWNFESIPDPRLPWTFVRAAIAIRGGFERSQLGRNSVRGRTLRRLLTTRMHKFRYAADYDYASRHGVLDVLVDSSNLCTDFWARLGIGASVLPWGTAKEWVDDAAAAGHPVRDIDVLWLGKRRTKRRSRLIDQLRKDLSGRGVRMVVVDGVEAPFVHGRERAELLARTKITLNLLPTWHDPNFPFRFHVVAPSRSMLMAESMPDHSPFYRPGVDHALARTDDLAAEILRYLADDGSRERVAEAAFRLVTTELTLRNAMQRLMGLVDERMAIRASAQGAQT